MDTPIFYKTVAEKYNFHTEEKRPILERIFPFLFGKTLKDVK